MKQIINVASLIKEIEHSLQTIYDDPTLCRQYAWWTLEAITHKDKATLITQQTAELTTEQLEKIKNWTDQMVKEQMPIQYLIGSVPFNGIDILVKPPTLIPRPETEEWTVNLILQLQQLSDQKLSILELCTGSGCIALALAKHFPQATVTASDIADDALELAQHNAKHNGIANVTFIKSDLYETIPNKKFDLIVANPPYISDDEWKKMESSVTEWENKGALVASDEGLEIIKKIIDGAQEFLRPNQELQKNKIPQLVIEIGYKQGAAVAQLVRNAGFTNIQIQKDLEGKDRIVTARVE